MRLPITVHHQYSNLSRITPKVAFPLTLPTSPQRQTLFPSLLQFRASSSSDDEKSNLHKQLRRLAHTQKALEDLEAIGGGTLRQMLQRADTQTPDEAKTIWDKMDAVEQEQLRMVSDLWQGVTLESHAVRNSSGSRGLGISQLIEEKYAEPIARLTPDERKLIDNAFRHTHKVLWKAALRSIFARVAKLAASFGFAYWLFRYLSAN